MHDAVLLLLLIGAGVGIWHWSITAHERVLAISERVCSELKLQRLDDTVSLRHIGLAMNAGRPTLRRTYGFEFSLNGVDRRLAEIGLLGSALAWVRVEHPDGPIFVEIGKSGQVIGRLN